MWWVGFLLVFCLYSLCGVYCDEDIMTFEEAKKFPVKKLKALLKDRGLECKGCAEKEDFAKMFVENQLKPDLKKEPVKEKKEKPKDDAKMEEVRVVSMNLSLVYTTPI
jgi:hypothetical protein